jgi:hypothetical protein
LLIRRQPNGFHHAVMGFPRIQLALAVVDDHLERFLVRWDKPAKGSRLSGNVTNAEEA